MNYDLEHEAKACVNELFYRDGPEPMPLGLSEATYALETIKRYMVEAVRAALEAAQ